MSTPLSISELATHRRIFEDYLLKHETKDYFDLIKDSEGKYCNRLFEQMWQEFLSSVDLNN